MDKLWLLLHVLFVVIGFGVAFAQPMIDRGVEASGAAFAKVATYVQAPAIALVLITGFGLAGADDVDMGAPWIGAAALVALAAIAVQVVLANAHRNGNATLVRAMTGSTHLLLLIGLYLMIWQPGA